MHSISNHKRHSKSKEQGSITVSVAFLLPTMVLMIVLIININQLVFTKIKLQNTVDACALSAAAVQATGLNEIADLNIEMAKEHENLVKIMRSGTWYDFGQAAIALSYFFNGKTGVIDNIFAYQNLFNELYAAMAEHVAQNVKEMNMPLSTLSAAHNTQVLTHLSAVQRPVSFSFYTASYSLGSPVANLFWSDPGDPRFAGNHDGSFYLLAKRSVSFSTTTVIRERVRKVGPTYVLYELELPAQNFLIAERIFGAMPTLTARAMARPAGGHIYDGKPYYQALLIR
ncbi:Tad domain-containing protein [Desulfonatronovibrio magnus]|uniref:Tad domain-containing protein n=1 Tax=Desulfonatronovibrio magnus TaxID=698827 RepID=UPI0005EBA472|nr:Tad domain-containing protein [Desulfonatronovibrio magnus]